MGSGASTAKNDSDQKLRAISSGSTSSKRMLVKGGGVPVSRVVTIFDPQREEKVTPVRKTPEEQKFILHSLKKCWLFENVSDDVLGTIVEKMGRASWKFGESIVEQGQKGSLFFLLAKGMTEVWIDGSKKKQLLRGTCFGELSLLYQAPRTATIKVQSESCDVWILDKHTFRMRLRKSDENVRNDNISFLAKIPFFSQYQSNAQNAAYLSGLSDALVPRTFEDGEYITKRGEVGDTFYIIKSGKCTVVDAAELGSNDSPKVLNRFSWFGEQALISSSSRRTASVVACGRVECLTMDARSYFDTLARFESFRGLFDAANEENTPSKVTNSSSTVVNSTTSHIPKVVLGDFDVEGFVGVGAFAAAFVAKRRDGSDERVLFKRMLKSHVVDTEMQDFVRDEVSLLYDMRNSAFVPMLYGTTSDDLYVYIAMEYCSGGEMLDVVNTFEGLPEKPHCMFVAACVVQALMDIHRHGIVFRDLKLENMVLDNHGYIRIIDFGLAKRVLGRTYTLCGSPRYCAPEVINGSGCSFHSDWWSLGICMYESFHAYSAFQGAGDTGELWRNILRADIEFDDSYKKASDPLKDFLRRLLTKDPKKRLGSLSRPGDRVVDHKWFEGFDWESFRTRKLKAPTAPHNFEARAPLKDASLLGHAHTASSKPYRKEDDVSPDWLRAF
eukprot:g64.t1